MRRWNSGFGMGSLNGLSFGPSHSGSGSVYWGSILAYGYGLQAHQMGIRIYWWRYHERLIERSHLKENHLSNGRMEWVWHEGSIWNVGVRQHETYSACATDDLLTYVGARHWRLIGGPLGYVLRTSYQWRPEPPLPAFHNRQPRQMPLEFASPYPAQSFTFLFLSIFLFRLLGFSPWPDALF